MNLTTRGLLLGAGLFVFGRLYVGSDGSCERLLLVSEILITKNDEGNSLRCSRSFRWMISIDDDGRV